MDKDAHAHAGFANSPGSATGHGTPRSCAVPYLQPPLTLLLHHVSYGQEALVGGKAANLSVLLRANVPVPPGFCVTTAAFNQFVDSSAERPQLSGLLSQVPSRHPHQLHELSTQVAHHLAPVPVPPPVHEAVLAAWRLLGEERTYAVRSSASVEDGVQHSFAGQFESVLNVRGPDALLAAIKHCWLSVFSPRALAYHAREHLPIDKTSLAVLVQEMVPAEAAGVLFTLDPVSGDTERMLIEAAPGLGDGLVAGRVDPETVVLDKAGFQVIQRRLPSRAPCLDDQLLLQLAQLAIEAERLFTRPLDIEWASVQGRVFLLQARPATAIPKPKSWEDRQHWSNVNTGEIFPDVATPMTWSVVQLLFAPLFGSLFRLVGADLTRAPAAGLVAGRIYFNANTGVAAIKRFRFLVGNLANVAHAVGGGEMSQYVRGLADIPESEVPDIGVSWPRYILSWPRILWDLLSHLPHRGDAWMLRLKARIDELLRKNVESMSTGELVDSITQVSRDSFEDWDLLYLVVQTAVLPLFHKACRDWLDDPNLAVGYRLFSGFGNVPEVEAGLALWRLAALADANAETTTILLSAKAWAEAHASLTHTEHGRQFLSAWGEFMSEHGHHCRGELELFNARWSETPDYILGLVRGYLGCVAQTDPVENHRRLAEQRRELTRQCLRRLNPLKRGLFSFTVRRAQRLAVYREAWKNQAVRQFFALRRMLLALGQRLHREGLLSHPDDIFFLELAEIEPVAAGNPCFNVRELIRSRREDYEYNLTLSPPSGVVGKFDPARSPVLSLTPDSSATQLQGIPVSPGVVTGSARVILHTDVHEHVLPGEILVVPFTDPAWTPYFIPAAGIVIDQGGILSHGSIVARELGLPAVTSTTSATRLIRTGDLLHLDGTCGRVTILKRAST